MNPSRILIVEDDAIIQRHLARSLSHAGYQVVAVVNSGEEAIRMAEEHHPDLALMDIQLSGERDGISTAHHLARALHIPVIYLTAYADKATLERARQTEPYGFLRKPFDDENLRAAIETALHRHAADRNLRASEERYRRLFENSVLGIFQTSLDGKILTANPALAHMLGFKSPEELIRSEDILSTDFFVNPEVRSKNIKRTLESPKPLNTLNEYRRRDGSLFTGSVHLWAVRDDAGNLLHLEGIIEDVTERQRAVQQAAIRLRQHAALAALSQQAVRRQDLQALLNDAVKTVAKNLPAEFVEVLQILPGNTQALLRAGVGWEKHMLNHARVPIAPRTLSGYTLSSGKTIIVKNLSTDRRVDYSPFHQKHGLVSGMMTAIAGQDITYGLLGAHSRQPHTFSRDDAAFLESVANLLASAIERQVAEDDLRLSEERFRAAFEQVAVGMLLADLDLHILQVNQRYCRMLQVSPEEILSHSFLDFTHPQDVEKTRAFYRRVRAGRLASPSYEKRYLRRDGSILWVNVTTSLIKTGGDNPGYFISAVEDITERKQREQETAAILTISTALRTAQTRAEMPPIILSALNSLLQLDCALLAFKLHGAAGMRVESATGSWQATPGTLLSAEKGAVKKMAASSAPLFNLSIARDSQLHALNRQSPAVLASGVPLIAAGKIIGALWVAHPHPLSQTETHSLLAIAEIAANAINRAALHEKAGQQVERLAALHSIDTAISTAFDLQYILGVGLKVLIRQLSVDAACVLVYDPLSNTLTQAVCQGFRGKPSSTLHLGEGLAGKAALIRKPVIMPNLTAEDDPDAMALAQSREGFVWYCALPLLVKGSLVGVLEVFNRTPLTPDPDWMDYLTTLASQAAIAIDNANLFARFQRTNIELGLAFDATLQGWARTLEIRDPMTRGHARHVADLVHELASRMGIKGDAMVNLHRGAILHDIGKIVIPSAILEKPGPLTEAEWEIMRQHPAFAHEMLSQIEYLRPAIEIPWCHHEKWDGSGYPRGLKGDAIPLSARIFAVVNVWDSLLSDRPYRKAWKREDALQYIREQRGIHFDPLVVDAFLRMMDETQPS